MATPTGPDRTDERVDVILRVLHRALAAEDGIEEVVLRLLREAHPRSSELHDALSTAESLPDADPAKAGLTRLLERALDSHLFRDDLGPAVSPLDVPTSRTPSEADSPASCLTDDLSGR